ncbi:MAG: hypothetical protein GY795_31865 [Desulfobacterales bacterium]|nr:hypothetical protein [Desulfobacterales bacterium]
MFKRSYYRVMDVMASGCFILTLIFFALSALGTVFAADSSLRYEETNLLTNPGFESGLDGWEVGDAQAVRGVDPPPHSGDSYLLGSSEMDLSYTSQIINLIAKGFNAQQIDSGMYSVHYGGWQAGWQEQEDKGKIEIILTDGTSELASEDMEWFHSNNTWELKEGIIKLVPGTRYITFGFHALRDSGKNNDAYLDDAFVFVSYSSDEDDLNKGLAAYYPFNGNANDESGNGNDGAVDGAVLTSDRFGNPDSAYSFDGNSNIAVSDSASLDIANAISVTGWINPNSLSPSWQTIIAKGTEPSENYAIFLERTKTLHIANVINNRRYHWNSDSLFTQTDTWYFLAVTYDGEIEKCYINGIYAGSEDISGKLTTNDHKLQIGIRGNSTPFHGIIDDIRIYNRDISESEIQSLYQQGDGVIKNFTANKTSGNAPLTVEFKDLSNGNPTS